MKNKRFLLLVPVLVLALMLSGCVQMIVKMDIKNDLSADVNIRMGIDEDYYDMAGGDKMFSEVDKGEAQGFTVSEYNADGYRGVETKGTLQNIIDSSSIMNEIFGNGFLTLGKDQSGKNTMKFRASISGLQSQISGNSGYSMSDLESYGKMDMRVIITLPYPVQESNATSVSGNTLTWDLLKFEGTEMEAFAIEGGAAVPVWLIIIIIAAAAAVAVFILLRMKKKKSAPADYSYGDRYNVNDYNGSSYGQTMDPAQGPYYSGEMYNASNIAPGAEAYGEQNTAPGVEAYGEQNAAPGVEAFSEQNTAPGAETYGTPNSAPASGTYAEQLEYFDPGTYSEAGPDNAAAADVAAAVNAASAADEEAAADNAPTVNEITESHISGDTVIPEEETVIKRVFCPQCGTRLVEGAVFCPQCGHKLK